MSGTEVRLLVGVGNNIKEHLIGPGGVEAVVHRLQVDMVPESDTPLAGPGSLADDEVVAAQRVRACFEFRSERHPVPVAGQRGPRQIGDGYGDVEVVVEASLDSGGRPGQTRTAGMSAVASSAA